MKNRTFLVSRDVMSLDTNIQQNKGILNLSVTKYMKISTKTTHSYTLLSEIKFTKTSLNSQNKTYKEEKEILPFVTQCQPSMSTIKEA